MTRVCSVLKRTGMICVLIGWFGGSAAADPILLSTSRLVTGRATIEVELLEWFDSVEASTGVPGPFNTVKTTTVTGGGGVASVDVQQHTTISPTGWSGSAGASTRAGGLADVEHASAFAEAQSETAIDFRLTEPMFYRFTGTVSGVSDDSGSGGFALVALHGPDFSWVLDSDGQAAPVLSRSGLLSPGDYAFRALALSFAFDGSQSSAFNFQFGLSDKAPVPEPATLLLFATGAAFVGRRAWRRRGEQSVAGGSAPLEEA